MGLFKRTSKVNITGFPVFGINPSVPQSGEMIVSNSYFPTGATQFSYFVCSRETEGENFDGNLNCCIGCFDIKLSKNFTNQAWLVKNSLIGVGQLCDGNKDQHYSIDAVLFVYSNFQNSYNISGPFTTTYSKTQNCFCVSVDPAQSGVIFKVYDSPCTKMKWTNKIEIIQSIYEQEVNLLTTEEQILNYFNTAPSPQSAATAVQVLNFPNQIPQINAGEDPGDVPISIFDGGEDV